MGKQDKDKKNNKMGIDPTKLLPGNQRPKKKNLDPFEDSDDDEEDFGNIRKEKKKEKKEIDPFGDSDDLTTLGEQTRSTQSQLQNTFNRFLMLQSGQFIENRVVRDQTAAQKIADEQRKKEKEEEEEKKAAN